MDLLFAWSRFDSVWYASNTFDAFVVQLLGRNMAGESGPKTCKRICRRSRRVFSKGFRRGVWREVCRRVWSGSWKRSLLKMVIHFSGKRFEEGCVQGLGSTQGSILLQRMKEDYSADIKIGYLWK